MQVTNKLKNITKFVLFINAFAIEAVFRARSIADKSIDLQVIIKMGIWVLTFMFCIGSFKLWGRKLLRIDNICLFMLLILITASCFYAPDFLYSAAAAFSLFSIIFLMLMVSEVLDNREMLLPIIYGCTLVMAISIVVYFVNPDFGRMKDWDGGQLVMTRRLTGIAGNANTAGYISAICLLTLYYYREYIPGRLPMRYWLCVVINFATLLMSNSRTSLMALFISIGIAGLMKPFPARLAAIFGCICVAMLFIFAVQLNWINIDALFALVARSGSASEIESGTGRTAIWAVVIEMIHQRPFFGWGYGSTTKLIPEASAQVGFTADHAHNALLQVGVSVGLVGLALFITVIFTKLFYSVRSGVQLNVAFIVFLLIDGLTEPIAFQGVATTTTLALATVLALNYGKENASSNRSYQQ
ncbi:MAG TPA: O-antigen ligase family protein [Rickettsiales bacterium]|nr:O-antigen ligase family protein [Rickettsiales bacterium]